MNTVKRERKNLTDSNGCGKTIIGGEIYDRQIHRCFAFLPMEGSGFMLVTRSAKIYKKGITIDRERNTVKIIT